MKWFWILCIAAGLIYGLSTDGAQSILQSDAMGPAEARGAEIDAATASTVDAERKASAD